jgi:hypothetical protein
MALLGDLWIPHYYHMRHHDCGEGAKIELRRTLRLAAFRSAGILPAIFEFEKNEAGGTPALLKPSTCQSVEKTTYHLE